MFDGRHERREPSRAARRTGTTSHEATAAAHEPAAWRKTADASRHRDRARDSGDGRDDGGDRDGRDRAVGGDDALDGRGRGDSGRRVRARASEVAELLAVVAPRAGRVEGAVEGGESDKRCRSAGEGWGRTRHGCSGTRRRRDPCRRTSSTACSQSPSGSGCVRGRSSQLGGRGGERNGGRGAGDAPSVRLVAGLLQTAQPSSASVLLTLDARNEPSQASPPRTRGPGYSRRS